MTVYQAMIDEVNAIHGELAERLNEPLEDVATVSPPLLLWLKDRGEDDVVNFLFNYPDIIRALKDEIRALEHNR